jgi:YfiH family protein
MSLTAVPTLAPALAEADLLRPAWPAPPGVGALMSTRAGGVSTGAFASLNLGRSVGDLAQAVAENRRRFVASLRIDASPAGASGARPARPVWLHQVHGTTVLELDEQTAEHPQAPADAAWTRTRGIACIVGAADCLPVLFAARDGRAVAAAHAGWRGLAGGVLEATVGALGRGAGVPPADLLAWLGPCIGARRFEVGADVLRAFGFEPRAADSAPSLHFPHFPHFRHAPRPDGEPRWLADLRGLATQRLRSLGVGFIAADDACTYEDASRFFSFRRDSRGGTGSPSGRMAAAVWLEAGAS